MTMLPTEMKLCCRMLGTAITAMRQNSGKENSALFSSVSTPRRRRSTKSTASTQLTPWQRNVAHATPATPILNAVTNRISMKMLLVEDAARKINGVLESPSAEKMPVATL